MDIIDLIVAILSGLAVCIPLAVNLVKYVKAAVKEKNWNNLLELLMGYMKQAEEKFSDGATRKEWVLAMIISSADTINYDVDIAAIGDLIDSLSDLTKVVNVAAMDVLEDGDASAL